MSNNPSSTDSEETVPVEWDDKDILAVAFGIANVPLEITSLSQSQILAFCGGCRMLDEHGVCRFGRHDQTRYVARKWCGWAKRDGSSS